MNHSYAVLKLMKNAATIAKINGISKLHYLNYDYIIQDRNLLPNQSESLDNNDLFYYYYTENENYMNTGIFSIKTQQMLDSFSHINSKSDYCDQGYPILEEYMLKRFKERQLRIDKDLLVNIKQNNKIDLIATSDFLTQKKIEGKEFNLYLYLSKEQNTNKLYLIVVSDIETNMIVRFTDKNYNIKINGYPIIIELDQSLVDTGFDVEVLEFNVREKFNNQKKLSSCTIHNYEVIKNFDDFEYEESNNLIVLEEIVQDTPKDFYHLSLNNQTDKVYYHGYHHFYPQYFEKFRYQKFNMLEIGYGDGASMKTWIEYFPQADITVLDINVQHIESDRCRVIKGDQSKLSDLDTIIDTINHAKLILDDGSHNPLHQFDTFNYLFKNLLEPGGVYIIEDIEVSYWNPESTLYGYKSGYFNLIDAFKKYQEMINSEFTGVRNHLNISSILFGQNCIIITKRTQEQIDYFNREYRFNECVDDVCHFGQP
jgi:phage antirepressor YoqD-like protein